jgi:hypothetical protein
MSQADPPGDANALPALPDGPKGSLSGALRTALLALLPDPLHESSPGWGQTKEVTTGVHWHGKGLHARPEVVRSPRNHGTWRKIRVSAIRPQETLVFELRDLRQTAADRLTFTAAVGLDVRAEVERQKWEAGVRLSSASLRARMHVKLTLDCDVEMRVESADGLLPDVVFRLHVARADLQYDNLVVEHVAGVGGTGARLLGEAVRSSVHRLHPSLERDLLARADAAIVRAGDNREVRLSLSKMFKREAPPAPAK